MRVTFDCACNWKGRGVGWGVRSLAWLGTGWIPLPGERFESFGGKGDNYLHSCACDRKGGGGGGGGEMVVSVVRTQLGCIVVGQKVRVLRDDW